MRSLHFPGMTDSDLHADPGTHPEKLGNRDRLVAAASVRGRFPPCRHGYHCADRHRTYPGPCDWYHWQGQVTIRRAILIGYRNDLLAWNPMGHALLCGHLPYDAPDQASTRPNMVRLIFCDPHMRELYADWKAKAQDAVGSLRLASGQHPDDPRLASLIGELSVASPEFARLWARHTVRQCRATVRGFRHPLVGSLTLSEEAMELNQDEGQRLALFSAEPGTPSEAGLRLLAGLTAEAEQYRAPAPPIRSAERSCR